MADSATVNHNFVLPEIGASQDSWGTKLNANFTQLDTLLKVGLGTFVRRAGDTMTGMLTLPVTVPTAGTHAAHKSYVDTQISASAATLTATLVPTTRNLVAGGGIQALGDLSADRTIAVDATVLRTSGAQSVAGAKTFSDALYIERTGSQVVMRGTGGGPVKELYYNASNGDVGIYDSTNSRWDFYIDVNGNVVPRGSMDASNLSGTINTARLPSGILFTGTEINVARVRVNPPTGTGPELWLRRDNGTNAGVLFSGATASDPLFLRAYNAAGTAYQQISLNGNTGELIATKFTGAHQGDGSGLTGLPAASLTGTINNARLSGDYSFSNLTLSGGLVVAGATGVRFANDDRLVYDDSDNSYSFTSDGTVSGTIIRAGRYLNSAGNDVIYDTRSVSAGNGLVGGGDLSVNRTISLGTPEAITATSNNSVTATGHSHYLWEGTIRQLMADGTAGLPGTYAFLNLASGSVAVDATVAGSNLRYSNAEGAAGGTPNGTWRCMGSANAGTTEKDARTTLWLRVA